VKIQQDTPEEMNAWVDWLYGKEAETSAIGNMSRFVQANVKHRPATGQRPRWENFTALRNINAYFKHFDPNDLEASIAAFRTDAG
jgi:ABC-type Fe3+ transport system substrate-binding protein